VHDLAAEACVRLEGTVNGQPWVIERTATATATRQQRQQHRGENRRTANSSTGFSSRAIRKGSKATLSFELSGEERTGQDMALTQAAINQELADPAVLRHVAFHGQHGTQSGSFILEGTDKQVKAAMGE
jgi:glutamate synthase domain-containing protein 3